MNNVHPQTHTAVTRSQASRNKYGETGEALGADMKAAGMI